MTPPPPRNPGSPVWLDGRLVEPEHAVVSVYDHGITVGDGVFETCKVIDGAVFALTRHLGRLRRSAEGLGLEMPYADDAIRAAVADVVAATPDAGRLRVTVTGGPAPMGSGRGDGAATVFIAAAPAADRRGPASAIVVPWPRNERGAVAGLKTVSYAENVVALARAAEHGADEALFLNTAGRLCEGTGTNVFVEVGGRLVTPPLSAGCLAGITRELLLEVTAAVEADIGADDLAEAEAAFLSSSTREVQPLSSIDGLALPACPGPATEAAAAAFAALVARTLDP